MDKTINKLSTKLKEHVWCVIAFAALLLLAVITYWLGGKGNEMVSYVSFAGAAVSIVLAVIVIVYTFYQTNRSEQNISEMRRLISEGQEIIAEKTGTVAERFISVEQTLQSVLQSVQLPKVKKETVQPLETKMFHFDFSNISIFAQYTLYFLVQSFKLQKRASLKNIIPLFMIDPDSKESARNFSNFAWGIIIVFQGFLTPSGFVSEGAYGVEIKEMPQDLEKYISKEFERIQEIRGKDQPDAFVSIDTMKQRVDTYLKGL